MNNLKQLIITTALLASLAACSDVDEEEVAQDDETFAEFVIDLVENTSDSTRPVDIQSLELEETRDESAFDSIFK